MEKATIRPLATTNPLTDFHQNWRVIMSWTTPGMQN